MLEWCKNGQDLTITSLKFSSVYIKFSNSKETDTVSLSWQQRIVAYCMILILGSLWQEVSWIWEQNSLLLSSTKKRNQHFQLKCFVQAFDEHVITFYVSIILYDNWINMFRVKYFFWYSTTFQCYFKSLESRAHLLCFLFRSDWSQQKNYKTFIILAKELLMLRNNLIINYIQHLLKHIKQFTIYQWDFWVKGSAKSLLEILLHDY